MKQKTFSLTAGIVFLIVATFHLSRVIFNWSVVIGDWIAPMLVSWIIVIIAGTLAYHGLKLGRKK